MESSTHGSRPRPRTQKKSEAKAKYSPSEDRPFRGQEQECSWPRTKDTGASVLKKIFFNDLRKNRKVFKNFFQATLTKKSLQKFFQAIFKRDKQKILCKFFARFLAFSNKILTIQKIVLSSSRGQANFQGLEASRPRT